MNKPVDVIVTEEAGPLDNDIKEKLSHLRMAESMGLKVTDIYDVRAFMGAMRYTETMLNNPGKTDEEIAGIMGVSRHLVIIWKRKEFVAIASQVVLAQFLSDNSRNDMRTKMFATLARYMPEALENVGRIAAGYKMKDGKFPGAKAQVDAYNSIAMTPLGQAFVNNLFLGDPGFADEKSHLQLRDGLSNQHSVDLDQVIDVEPVIVQTDSAPADV